MSKVTLLKHQDDVIENTKDKNKVAYYLDMGLGKTYVGSEKMINLHSKVNLIVCQKSKVDDWFRHFVDNYSGKGFIFNNLTDKLELEYFIDVAMQGQANMIGIINYDLIWRRKDLLKLNDFTLMLDESSLIQNETSKRSNFILKLNATNVILLSGTPTSGRYENLWSQMHLLGWDISKDMYYKQYVEYERSDDGYPVIKGYKNVDRLKKKMRDYGCIFMKTEDVIDLPKQNFININVPESKEYQHFKKHGIVNYKDDEIVGDTILTKLLYSRMLCGSYNENKIEAFKDLVESTNDRLIVFYSFNAELESLVSVLPTDRQISVINGNQKDLTNYEKYDNSITFIQYQAGSMGLNLQKANKIIYFTPTLSSEMFEQSKKRIHRIGQDKPCFYYLLKTGIDYRIYNVLQMRKNYTDNLFEEDLKNG